MHQKKKTDTDLVYVQMSLTFAVIKEKGFFFCKAVG